MRKILRSYLFWTYPRGSFHYDVMVTLILAFIFLSPMVINYRDRPQEMLTSTSGVLVKMIGSNGFVYSIGAGQIENTANEAALKAQLEKRIQAISGDVQLDHYTAQKDASGHVIEYRVWAYR
jgi:hypothetical protein